jgi:hypothetical protein
MILERGTYWFREVSNFYSFPGLLLGLAGVIILARQYISTMPLAVVVAHFLIGISLGIFSQYDRTIAYLLPFLILGGGCAIYTAGTWVFEKSRPASVSRTAALSIAAIVTISATLHVAIEIPRLAAPESIRKWGPLVGPADWKPIIADFDKRIPDGSHLIPWDYGTQHQYRSMSERAGKSIKVVRPLETLNSRRKSGSLNQYIDTRGLTLSADNPIFILAPRTIELAKLHATFSTVVGAEGFGLATPKRLILVGERTLPRSKHLPRGIRLYLVTW